MKAIQAFQAADGTIYATEAECVEREFSLVWRDRIGAFQKSRLNPYTRGAQLAMVLKVILAWEQFKTASVNEKAA